MNLQFSQLSTHERISEGVKTAALKTELQGKKNQFDSSPVSNQGFYQFNSTGGTEMEVVSPFTVKKDVARTPQILV